MRRLLTSILLAGSLSCASVPEKTAPLLEHAGFDYSSHHINDLSMLSCIRDVSATHLYQSEDKKFHTSTISGSGIPVRTIEGRTYLLTNAHVLKNKISSAMSRTAPDNVNYHSSHYFVRTKDKEDLLTARLEFMDENEDVALLSLPKISLCLISKQAELLTHGHVLYASGYRDEKEIYVSRGIYAGRSSNTDGASLAYRSDAIVHGGQSGGGIFAISRGRPEIVGMIRTRTLSHGDVGFIGLEVIKKSLGSEWTTKLFPEE